MSESGGFRICPLRPPMVVAKMTPL